MYINKYKIKVLNICANEAAKDKSTNSFCKTLSKFMAFHIYSAWVRKEHVKLWKFNKEIALSNCLVSKDIIFLFFTFFFRLILQRFLISRLSEMHLLAPIISHFLYFIFSIAVGCLGYKIADVEVLISEIILKFYIAFPCNRLWNTNKRHKLIIMWIYKIKRD